MKIHVLLGRQLVIEARILEDNAERLAHPFGSLTGSTPFDRMVPDVGWSSVVSILIVVVLPAPFGPRNAKI